MIQCEFVMDGNKYIFVGKTRQALAGHLANFHKLRLLNSEYVVSNQCPWCETIFGDMDPVFAHVRKKEHGQWPLRTNWDPCAHLCGKIDPVDYCICRVCSPEEHEVVFVPSAWIQFTCANGALTSMRFLLLPCMN